MAPAMSQEQRARHIEQVFGTIHSCPLRPIAQARHRYSRRSSRNVPYDPNSQAKLEIQTQVKQYLRDHYGITHEEFPLTESYVSVNVTFLINRPISHFTQKKRSQGIRPNFEMSMPMVQGDIDNFVKLFLDSIQGIFFRNDRDVVTISASKLYTNEPRGRTVYSIRHHEMNIVDLING